VPFIELDRALVLFRRRPRRETDLTNERYVVEDAQSLRRVAGGWDDRFSSSEIQRLYYPLRKPG
jgi:hypothetical protein